MSDQEFSSLELPLFQRRKSKSLTPLIFGCEDNGVAVRMCPTPDEYSCPSEESDSGSLKTPFSEKTLTPGFGFEKYRRISSSSFSSVGCGASTLGSSDSCFSLSKTSPNNNKMADAHSPASNNVGTLVSTPSLLDCLPIETLEERMYRWVLSDSLEKETNFPPSSDHTPPLVLKHGINYGEIPSRKDAIQSPPVKDNHFYLCSPGSSGYISSNTGSPYPDLKSDVRSSIGSPSVQRPVPQTSRELQNPRRNNKRAFEF